MGLGGGVEFEPRAVGHPPKVDAALIEQIKSLPGKFKFETFISLSCHNCPDVVQALNLMAVLNPGVESTMIDGALFQKEAEARQIMAVPVVYLNGEAFGQGRMTIEEIAARLDTGAAARAAQEIDAKAPFDVLVGGGGPAGAAAAIYAARKGIRTGVVAERFGGQVLDTLAIENFISVKHTEGPQLAVALEQHVKEYGVDIMPNVTIITSALTTEVVGDGHKVTGLIYKDRNTEEVHRIELEGIFVQIGLLPNTDWLKGTVALSKHGEIEVDARGQTSVAGVFAAGDCTTVPYKQIVIAMGEGAKASLSAFDHLIRSSNS